MKGVAAAADSVALLQAAPFFVRFFVYLFARYGDLIQTEP
jgi:hypothetical protein